MKGVYRWTVLSTLLVLTVAEVQITLNVHGTVEPQNTPAVRTSSGFIIGRTENGVSSFKGIRYGVAPVGELRWTPPIPFFSYETFQADTFGSSCIQQFPQANQNLTKELYNTPPPASESEDCLFLNVWAPTDTSTLKPVLVWIHGGSLAFGHGSAYDGASILTTFVQNQSIVVVTFNYRTNVFGFPGYSAFVLPPKERNLGFMDQDLALAWVQTNIRHFGGDPDRVTVNGQSAGSMSVGHLLQRHKERTPFRAAILQSGSATSIVIPPPNRLAFANFVQSHNCTQLNPRRRLQCLKEVPAETIQTWLNGNTSSLFSPYSDGVTAFCDPFPRILAGQTANVPLLIGANQDDGSFFAPMPSSNASNVTLEEWLAPMGIFRIDPETVRELYPGRKGDHQIISDVIRDAAFLCPSQLTAESFVEMDQPNVYRYVYGAVFDPEPFPDAGAWHGSEIDVIWGTYNKTTATPEKAELSRTIQTIWANFIVNPFRPPHPAWPRYNPTPGAQTLARLGFNGSVSEDDVVKLTLSGVYDTPCNELWNRKIVDNRLLGCLA